MRDQADNVVIICSIENLDPMGVHTGDSITVAPAMTLTDREYQHLRDLSIGIIRSVGVDTGGCNIQFAVNPADGRVVVIEMNPRVSRSSALASKATGFPIAKIAAKVAIGYTLDEIPNDITTAHGRGTPASFEPTLDYVVVKVPALRVREVPLGRPDPDHPHEVGGGGDGDRAQLHRGAAEGAAQPGEQGRGVRLGATPVGPTSPRLPGCSIRAPHDGRLRKVMDALRAGATPEELHDATAIDPWFLDQLLLIDEVATAGRRGARARRADRCAWPSGTASPTPRSPAIRGMREDVVRGVRHALGHPPGLQDRRHLRGGVRGADALPLLLLRRGERGAAAGAAGRDHPRLRPQPHRAGHRVRLLLRAREPGAVGVEGRGRLRDVMVNCNPETVSTDYDTSDRLYFEPLTLEDVLEIVHAEQQAGPVAGRHLPARRPDPARPRAGAGGRGRPDRGHLAGGDPPGRGARRVRPGARPGGPAGTQARTGDVLRRGAGDRRRDRLPGPGAAVLRPRRSRHGDRLRRRRARAPTSAGPR